MIKVGRFIFSVDFIVLKTEVTMSPENKIPVILDRPFRTLSNTLINCRSGNMKLTFENMTIELNVFNLKKQLMGFDDVEQPTLNWTGDF